MSSESLLCWDDSKSAIEGRCFFEDVGGVVGSWSCAFLFAWRLDVFPRSAAVPLRDLVIYCEIRQGRMWIGTWETDDGTGTARRLRANDV
jgi:hypothetical protein